MNRATLSVLAALGLALAASAGVALGAPGPVDSLAEAVKRADREAVRTLLRTPNAVNLAEPDGTTPLHWAAHGSDVSIADMLIRAGAEVGAANRYGVRPLSLACINGHVAMIERLLKAGADPNTAQPQGETALMTAARTGNVEAVKLLLAHGASVNAKERWRGQTAVMWAAAEGHAAVVRALVERGADFRARSNGGFTPLLFAAREGHIGAATALLDLGASLNEALPGERRRAPDAPEGTPPEEGLNAFLLAAANAHYELAALLLERGADPNAAPKGWTALHQLSWVRKMGNAGSNNPPPEGSGRMDSLEFARRLVRHGAQVNARVTRRPPAGITRLNMIGGTPFLLAARTADAELMQVLVDLGADPLLPNDEGTTPLMVAAGVGTSAPGEDPGTEPEVLEATALALKLGGNVNAVDKNGETAMHGAATKHVPSVVRFLADSGADIAVWDRPNKDGHTPLKITEGIHRGMNIISSPATAAAIREVMSRARP
jgi:ankyrin repeat protein